MEGKERGTDDEKEELEDFLHQRKVDGGGKESTGYEYRTHRGNSAEMFKSFVMRL